MARGQQKIQSQQKAAEKTAKAKKAAVSFADFPKISYNQFSLIFKGHSLADQKAAAAKALTLQCVVCKSQMPDPKTYKQHFENKHPKADLPADLKDI